jgi:hypothetical protein
MNAEHFTHLLRCIKCEKIFHIFSLILQIYLFFDLKSISLNIVMCFVELCKFISLPILILSHEEN